MALFPPAGGRPGRPVNPEAGRAGAPPPAGGRRWPYAVLFVTVLSAGALSQTPPAQGLLRRAGITGAPSSYTELAFVTPGDLPQQLVAAEATRLPAFSIHNATRTARRYRWSVTLTSAGAATRSVTGEAAVRPGDHVTVTPTVRVDCRPGPLTVTVSLAENAESIGFTTDCLATDSGDLS